ncbi:MAG: hypothetical protein K6F08_00735 [bacterium]|nr:hypothetical protein [bacterium]
MEQNFQTSYDQLLSNVIPHLKQFPHEDGGEGFAYFLNDKFVVKEYDIAPKEFLEKFDEFCLTLQKMANSGIRTPKIYAWKKVKNASDKNPHYYILEERINSKNFYPPFIYDYCDAYEGLCDPATFYYILKNPNENKKLFNEIVTRYQKAFLSSNAEILSYNDSILEKFITDIFEFNKNAKIAKTDLAPSNVFRNDKEIIFIDPYYNNEFEGDDSLTLLDICGLIYPNSVVNYYSREILDRFKSDADPKRFVILAKKNQKLSYYVADKFIDLINKNYEDLNVSHPRVRKEINQIFRETFTKDQRHALMSKIKFNDCGEEMQK